jgi:hypothetical protein
MPKPPRKNVVFFLVGSHENEMRGEKLPN